jgi:hypothetical protein
MTIETGTKKKPDHGKILLTILPYWSPIVPPAGLAALKSFLQPRGYEIKAVDMNKKKESLEFYYGYFNVLKKKFLMRGREIFTMSVMISCKII